MQSNEDYKLDIGAELNRKVLDAIERLLNEYHQGMIDDAVYARSLQAINDVTRGLVDGDLIDLLDKEANAALSRISRRH